MLKFQHIRRCLAKHIILMFQLQCTRATGINYERYSKQGRKLKNAGNGKQNWAGREEEFVNVKVA